jgi:HTH-type transcriptional regulator/antitoxin HigA
MTNHLIEDGQDYEPDFEVNTSRLDLISIEIFIAALKTLNIPDLIAKEILPKTNTESYLFSLISDNPNTALFRKNQNASDILTNLWVSKVIKKAKKYFIQNPHLFFNEGSIDKDFLREFSSLSKIPSEIKKTKETLLKKGIILVIEPYISGSKVDGVTLTLPNGIPVVGLSLRYNRLDSFWFTLLHELSHICLHYELLATPIIDDLDNQSDSKIEKQANLLAKFSIINKQALRTIDYHKLRSEPALRSFAAQQNVHPALVAGIVRFQLNNYSIFSKLINQFNVKELLHE